MIPEHDKSGTAAAPSERGPAEMAALLSGTRAARTDALCARGRRARARSEQDERDDRD
ncbi:MAG: hypothetical protein NVSMB25_24370 [Thermoleophilaceae bacterium]